MKQRIITALLLAPLVIAGIFFLPLSGFILALALVTFLGFWEWTQFVSSSSRYLALIPSVVAGGVSYFFLAPQLALSSELSSIQSAMLMTGSVWWVFSSVLAVTYPKSRGCWESSNTVRHLFGLLTLLPFFWSVIFLRAEHFTVDSYHGAKLVLFVCLIVWAADSGAYFAGKSFGKHKMAPAVSPNKTIEGLMGGVVAAMMVGWFFADVFSIQFTSSFIMMLTILITVVISVLGDLVESMFKRVSGIKDSSNLIPGHGGILDRIDSLTAAFPVFALLYFLF
ncbi:CDP-diglyceride synthetase [Vibrio sp. V27_P1S3P104]|uniref:phosphatidate cytidylyltransferase n=1 Tax=Vibrio TaxID=662 RepID=UPI000C16B146|nr:MULTISPECIES: phosphatidate cytidylyltransferase [Vibrio]NAW68559.1 CDP-diglyceride synthetase [Vibrio sp. V28_P6S34P95]NAX06584.1 CDP-diglyceride synthetase [Vibrio sp. V30_P3S12P165]NAX33425.1 CDP-diglyceride synthetase [Vibrio sp. V29_P1S30P107]NAX37274.1 CDP-diglyceride synthetase [Vibrio sp. V27_P1S3P104]NAX40046.1 CDP-diglyceride synthetase [Vibrio sp. V26_P1S5P106]